MGLDTHSLYAITIVCLLAFVAVLACIGVYLFKRLPNSIDQKQTLPITSKWEPARPMSTLTQLETVDLQTMKEIQRWQANNPPNTKQYINIRQQPEVMNKGVLAWKFIESTGSNDQESNAAVIEGLNKINFCQGQGNIMTNLPVPNQEFCYWEVKVLQLNDENRLVVGLATKPYPRWTLPGFHKHSIAYHSNTGSIFASNPMYGKAYGPPIKQGDVIGIGYLGQSGTVFFTRNGKNLGKASIGFKFPIYPILGSIGPCQVSINFGFEDFLFAPANQREAGFAPRQGSLLPPPAYGGHVHDNLFNDNTNQLSVPNESDLTYNDQFSQPPPSYS